jgi:hypothetical protein
MLECLDITHLVNVVVARIKDEAKSVVFGWAMF